MYDGETKDVWFDDREFYDDGPEEGDGLWEYKKYHVGGPYVPPGGYDENYMRCLVCKDEPEPGEVKCAECEGVGYYGGVPCCECDGKGTVTCPNCGGDPEREWFS
jgi:hypothetical protein